MQLHGITLSFHREMADSSRELVGSDTSAASQTIRSEAANHPRIAAAIRELEGAIAYMERAPHDFGGHKAAAIRDSQTALVELRAALAYRAQKDR